MQTASNFDHLIGKERLGIAKDVFDNPTPFDSCNDVFDANPDTGDDLVVRFFRRRERLPFGLFLGLIDRDTRGLVALQPRILKEIDARWEDELFNIAYPFVVHATGIRLTQIAHQTLLDIDDEVVLDCIRFFFRCTDLSAQWQRLDDAPGAPCHRS